jgi:hypothetical protein
MLVMECAYMDWFAFANPDVMVNSWIDMLGW